MLVSLLKEIGLITQYHHAHRL